MVTVATRSGYKFTSSDPALPKITSAGKEVSEDQADFLVTESDGLVFIVDKED